MRQRSTFTFCCAALFVAAVSVRSAPAQSVSAPAVLADAYARSVAHLVTALQASDKAAASDALITVLAVDRSLTTALDRERVRIEAAATRVPIGESDYLTLLRDAFADRATLALFAGQWIATDDADARTDALADATAAVAKTQAAVAAITPLLTTIGGVPLPPALQLDVTTTRHANGAFVLLVDVANLGGEPATQVRIRLRNGDSIGGSEQEVAVGSINPGARVQHLFAVALPSGVPEGTTLIEVTAGNASSEAYTVELDDSL